MHRRTHEGATLTAEQLGAWDVDFAADIDTTDGVVITLSGELDLASEHELRPLIDQALATGSNVVFDVSELRFLDSFGVSLLLGAHRRAKADQRSIILRGVQPNVRQVLAMTALTKVFNITD